MFIFSETQFHCVLVNTFLLKSSWVVSLDWVLKKEQEKTRDTWEERQPGKTGQAGVLCDSPRENRAPCWRGAGRRALGRLAHS